MTILIMAKIPRPGFSKTRLSPPCTPEQAAALAEAALLDSIDAALASGAAVVVALGGVGTYALPDSVRSFPQVGETFSERLAHAWSQITTPAIQIGMDTPQVTSSQLKAALDTLEHESSVIGLTEDGGWWIIGFQSPPPPATFDVEMSTANTGELQLTQLDRDGFTPAQLEVLRDVDTWTGTLAVAAQTPYHRFGKLMYELGSSATQ